MSRESVWQPLIFNESWPKEAVVTVAAVSRAITTPRQMRAVAVIVTQCKLAALALQQQPFAELDCIFFSASF